MAKNNFIRLASTYQESIKYFLLRVDLAQCSANSKFEFRLRKFK